MPAARALGLPLSGVMLAVALAGCGHTTYPCADGTAERVRVLSSENQTLPYLITVHHEGGKLQLGGATPGEHHLDGARFGEATIDIVVSGRADQATLLLECPPGIVEFVAGPDGVTHAVAAP